MQYVLLMTYGNFRSCGPRPDDIQTSFETFDSMELLQEDLKRRLDESKGSSWRLWNYVALEGRPVSL